jgi:hypothetical protein
MIKLRKDNRKIVGLGNNWGRLAYRAVTARGSILSSETGTTADRKSMLIYSHEGERASPNFLGPPGKK